MPDATPIVLQQIDLDIVPGKNPPIVHVSEYDTGRRIIINLFKDGMPYGSRSWSVKVEGTIGDYCFIEDADWVINDDYAIIFKLTESMTAVRGRVWTKIKLVNASNDQLSSCGFWLDCDRAGVEAPVIINAPGFAKQIRDAVSNRVDSVLPNYIPVNVVSDAVNEWMDNHPEVIIDPEIRAIDSFTQMKNTTAEEITVIQDDSYFGSGETVTFMVARNLASGEKQTVDGGYATDFYPFLKRNNDDYMVPKPHNGSVGSPAPANQIGAVIASYFDHPEILYGSTNTPFSSELDREAPMRIDCSGFASLVLYGIGYEKSRFVSDNVENVPGAYAGMTLPRNPRTCIGGENRRYCYNAAEMAMYYAQQNRLFYIDYERERPAAQLQVGDVLFFSHDFVYESDTDYGRRYLHIDHAAIVLSVYPESDTVLVANAGLPLAPRYWEPIRSGGGSSNRNNINLCFTQISGFDAETKMGTVVYARPIYPFLEQKPVQIIKRAEFKTDVPSPTTPNTAKILSRLFFKKPMAANRIYTLIAEGDLPNDPALHDRLTLLFSDGTNSIHQRITELVKFGDKVGYVFIPPEDVEQMQNVYLSAFLPTAAEGTDENIYNLRKIAVYEGVCPDAPALIERIDEPMTLGSAFDVNATSAEYEAWKDGATLHLHFKAPISASVASDSMVSIGTVKPDYFAKSGTERNLTCVVGVGDTRPMLVSASGVVSVYAKTTDTTSTFFKFDLAI